ncbi:MAG: hypothetical protein HUJ58_00010, partial [Erysipelotrichaceae bacterium]|nr:hypothetical protein [Erysipelotrichaceae bacterium]
MIDLIPYKKGNNTEADTDFKEKKKYGEVYYAGNHVFVRKGLGWLYASLQGATGICLSRGTR